MIIHSFNIVNYYFFFFFKDPSIKDAGHSSWPPSLLDTDTLKRWRHHFYSPFFIRKSIISRRAALPASGHKGITWPHFTGKWQQERPLSSALWWPRTPPDVPSLSGRATARSPGDSNPGTPPWCLPADPQWDHILSALPKKVNRF